MPTSPCNLHCSFQDILFTNSHTKAQKLTKPIGKIHRLHTLQPTKLFSIHKTPTEKNLRGRERRHFGEQTVVSGARRLLEFAAH